MEKKVPSNRNFHGKFPKQNFQESFYSTHHPYLSQWYKVFSLQIKSSDHPPICPPICQLLPSTQTSW